MLMGELKRRLDERLMAKLAYDWDNVGLLIGREDQEIQRILLTLEVSMEVIEEARDCKADLIIAHHPFIFRGLKSITTQDEKGRQVLEVIKNNIAVYSCHTNYDIMKGGLNDYVADLIGLQQVQTLTAEDSQDKGIGRIGTLDREMSLEELAAHLMQVLGSRDIRMIKGSDRMIRRVGIVTGAGMEYLTAARERGCDVFITGDLKYHEAQDALQEGSNVIDAGHYGTEIAFSQSIQALLKKEFGEQFTYFRAEKLRNPFIVLTS